MNEEKRESEGEGESGGILGWKGFDGGLHLLRCSMFCVNELGRRWGDSRFSVNLLLFIRMRLIDGYEVLLELL